MAQKVEVTELTDLFQVIDLAVKDTNMPERQKIRWVKNLKRFAKAGHDLGKHGKAEISS